MTVEKITDHEARILDLEIEQFKGTQNTTAILRAIANELQAIENMFFQIIQDRWISTAVGAQLDVIGKLVGFARRGLSDDDYRARIIAQIQVNIGGGQVENIVAAILNFATPNSIQISEVFPAAIQVSVEYPALSGPEIGELVARVKAAGVELIGIIESGNITPDYIVADEAERLALTSPPLEVGDVVLQQDTGSYWAYNGGDPSDPGNWTLVGPPFVFYGDDGGEGFADVTQVIGSNYIGGGVLGDLIF